MRRTRLYPSESTWKMLHARARQLRVTISELVRQAIQEKYEKSIADSQEAMRAIIGLWEDRKDIGDSTTYIRKLRKSSDAPETMKPVLLDSDIIIDVMGRRNSDICANTQKGTSFNWVIR